MAEENCLQVGRPEIGAGTVFLDLGIVGSEDEIEVAAITRRVGPADEVGEHQLPKPRSWRQAQEGVAEQAEKGGKANAQVLVEAAAPTRSFTGRTKRDSDPADDLQVLLRHPRSIPLTRGASQ
jgi:hypothetical protein